MELRCGEQGRFEKEEDDGLLLTTLHAKSTHLCLCSIILYIYRCIIRQTHWQPTCIKCFWDC